MSSSLDPGPPDAAPTTQTPGLVVPRPRSSAEDTPAVTAPADSEIGEVDPGSSPVERTSPSRVVALLVVCLLLVVVLGALGFLLWEVSQGEPLTGLFQP